MLTKILYRIAPFFFNNPSFNENYGRHLIESFIAKDDHKIILDLGAGVGDDLAICKNFNPAASLYAVESFPEYVIRLKKNGIEVLQLNIERDYLPFKTESVDLIIINQVLEHTKDIFWILHECARILKVGGTLIVGVPNLAAWHNRIILLAGIQPPAIASLSCHVRGFTWHDLKELLELGGIDVISIKSAGFYPFSPKLSRFLTKILPSLGWSIHIKAKKIKKYNDQFLIKAKSLEETNFYVG